MYIIVSCTYLRYDYDLSKWVAGMYRGIDPIPARTAPGQESTKYALTGLKKIS